MIAKHIHKDGGWTRFLVLVQKKKKKKSKYKHSHFCCEYRTMNTAHPNIIKLNTYMYSEYIMCRYNGTYKALMCRLAWSTAVNVS